MNEPFTLSTEVQTFFGIRTARVARFNGAFYTYEPSGAYREISEEVIRAEIRRACPWALTSAKVSNALDEIKSARVIDSHSVTLPCWIDEAGRAHPVGCVIVCANGILNPLTAQLTPHDDRLFILNALPCEFDPRAPTPQRWLRFLWEVFSGDSETITELQKMFGYLVSGDTKLQKIFAIIGPTRSGKGTLARVLEALIGASNVAGPSFGDLSRDFGMQSLIGKQLAVIADARVTHQTDRMAVAEKLLKISGEDSLDVPRKYLEPWHGRLSVRFLILSNELPALPDQSGALSARYVLFHTPNSFAGHEDRGLDAALRLELSGILLWALEGLRRLMAEGTIRTPASAREIMDEVDSLGSPIKAFAKERCTLAHDLWISKDDLWFAYQRWHQASGIPGHPLSKEMFSRSLKTAFPGRLKDYRPRSPDNAPRPMCWSGITAPLVTVGQPFGQP
jgi:putative DNA primase/helicase